MLEDHFTAAAFHTQQFGIREPLTPKTKPLAWERQTLKDGLVKEQIYLQ